MGGSSSRPSSPSCPSSPAFGYKLDIGEKGSNANIFSPNKTQSLSIGRLVKSFDSNFNDTNLQKTPISFSKLNTYITNTASVNTLSTMLTSATRATQSFKQSTNVILTNGVAKCHRQSLESKGACNGSTDNRYSMSYVSIPKNLPAKVRFCPEVNVKSIGGTTRYVQVQIALYDKLPTKYGEAPDRGINLTGKNVNSLDENQTWISSIKSVMCVPNEYVKVSFDEEISKSYIDKTADSTAYVAIKVDDNLTYRGSTPLPTYEVNFTFSISWLRVI
jgi:hypothetical protein